MPMSDEEWEASKAKKKALQDLANNPTDNMTVYRMQSGPGESLGIHWSTDENVSHYTGLGGGGDDRIVHRATVDRNQIITRDEWFGKGIRHAYQEGGKTKLSRSQWGFDSEAEVRLRPGTTLRDHATAPQGTHEYTLSGRSPSIEDRGREPHANLVHSAVPKTAEYTRLSDVQFSLPHRQQSFLDPIHERSTGRLLGYTPDLDAYWEHHGDEGFEAWYADAEKIAASQGVGEHEWIGERKHEPLLEDLNPPRSRSDEFKVGHKRDDDHPTLF